MQQDLIATFSRVQLPAFTGSAIPHTDVVLFNEEICLLGYTFDKPVMDGLTGLSLSDFVSFRTELLVTLGNLSGANSNHTALFNGFPYETVEDVEYLIKRVVGHLASIADKGGVVKNNVLLSCGHVLYSELFEADDFSACPICQHQVPELSSSENIQYQYDRFTPLKLLGLADDEFLTCAGNRLLNRNSSLSRSEKNILSKVVHLLDEPSTVYKENLPFVYALNPDFVSKHLSGATDVLRIATYLSDPENGDLSLRANTKFKLSKRHKNKLMRFLDSMNNLPEDLLRHREKWLRLGEIMNPGTKENSRKYPNVSSSFAALRNFPEIIPSFNREMEVSLRSKTVDDHFLALLSSRPGELGRKLDFALRNASDPQQVLSTFQHTAGQMNPAMLLGLKKYFTHRARSAADRVFFPAGSVNKAQIVADKRKKIDGPVADAAIKIANDELLKRFAELPALGRVYVDPALKDLIIPFNKRGDASSNIPVTRGSHYSIDPSAQVLRMFVHWTGDDVDLSVVQFDEHFEYQGDVAYYQMSDTGIVHSGDIRSAPNGASEFIDIDIEKLHQSRIRYIATFINVYVGEKFLDFPCYVGFMERDAVTSGKKFEPASVKYKMDLNSPAKANIPMLFDIKKRKVVFVDLSLPSRQWANARSTRDKIQAVCNVFMNLRDRKPTFYDLATLHAEARGTIVSSQHEADFVFNDESVSDLL